MLVVVVGRGDAGSLLQTLTSQPTKNVQSYFAIISVIIISSSVFFQQMHA